MEDIKVALIIGHNSRSKGAYSSIIGSEYNYWKNIAEEIKYKIPGLVDVYEREASTNYVVEMNKVLRELNSKDYKFCLELHYNSALSKQANGCECLVFWKNEKAKKLAKDFMEKLKDKFGSRIRTKENTLKVKKKDEKGKDVEEKKKEVTQGLILVQDSNTRGAYGICKSKDTYILAEPFFGSNDNESLKFSITSDVVDLFVEFIKEN